MDRSTIATLVLLVVGAFVVIPLLTMGGGMMGYGGFGMGGGAGMFVWPLLFVALVLVLGYAVVNRDDAEPDDTALETLRQRYARGELTDEEFEDRRRTLENQNDY